MMSFTVYEYMTVLIHTAEKIVEKQENYFSQVLQSFFKIEN